MQFKHLALASLAGLASAQSPGLLQALSNNTNVSQFVGFLNSTPAVVAALNNATNITVLAPANSAFSAAGISSATALNSSGMIQALLAYHILNGSYPTSAITNASTFIPTYLNNSSYANVTGGQVVEASSRGNDSFFFSGLLNNASITQSNINFTGGTIHIINRVLTLPVNLPTTAEDLGLTAAAGALNSSGLEAAIDRLGDLTVFAPDNAAFQAVGSALANLSTADLAAVLAYHVVNGSGAVAYSPTLRNGTTFGTLNGQSLTVYLENGTTFVNGARVVRQDVLISNGVMHVIDNVLNPSSSTASPTATTGAAAFSGATSVSNVPYTSGQPTPTTTVASDAGGTQTAGAGGAGGAAGTSGVTATTGTATSSMTTSSTSGAAVPAAMRTGCVGVGAVAVIAAGAAVGFGGLEL